MPKTMPIVPFGFFLHGFDTKNTQVIYDTAGVISAVLVKTSYACAEKCIGRKTPSSTQLLPQLPGTKLTAYSG